MIPDWRATTLGILLAGYSFIFSSASVFAQQNKEQDGVIAKIAMDWKRRLESSKNIKYRVAGHTVLTKNYLAEEYPGAKWKARDVILNRKFTMVIDFQGKRQRTDDDNETFNSTYGKVARQTLTTVFDTQSYRGSGTRFFDGVEQKRTDSTDLGIMTKNFHLASFDSNLRPVFAGHGIVIIPPRPEINMENMNQETKIDDLVFVHGNGVYGGHACVILRTPARKGAALSYSEYWIDLSRDSALIRQLEGSEKYPVFEWSIAYAKTPIGWLVDSWTKTHRTYARDSGIITASRDQFKVEERVADYVPNADEFTLLVKPGMLVRKVFDESKANQKLFRVDSSGREHQVKFEAGVEQKIFGFDDYAFYGALALALGVFGIAIWKFRYKFVQSRSQA